MNKALLVDDEEAIRTMLASFLEDDGFTVITASSAATAVAMLKCQELDVVITDLRMESPLAGFEVVRAATRLVPRPVIVVLTAFPVPQSDWREAGADLLIVKGANPFGLAKQLKAVLERRTSS